MSNHESQAITYGSAMLVTLSLPVINQLQADV